MSLAGTEVCDGTSKLPSRAAVGGTHNKQIVKCSKILNARAFRAATSISRIWCLRKSAVRPGRLVLTTEAVLETEN